MSVPFIRFTSSNRPHGEEAAAYLSQEERLRLTERECEILETIVRVNPKWSGLKKRERLLMGDLRDTWRKFWVRSNEGR